MKAMERLTRRPALFPPWVVLHVPHDAITIPTDVRGQFLLTDVELREELRRMTDHFTHALFAGPEAADSIVRAPVSRLVVDVERFPDDADEPMAARGMGAIYEVTSRLVPLRRKLTAAERETLLATYYRPHHAHLELVVSQALERFGRCLVLDCHSFPSVALPYEQANPTSARPDICIGTDEFHTNAKLAGAFLSAFQPTGWQVSLNAPFAGALVPASRYRKDDRVQSVMIEVNRRLYLHEPVATLQSDFAQTAQVIRQVCCDALMVI